jgi:hypothetical protein
MNKVVQYSVFSIQYSCSLYFFGQLDRNKDLVQRLEEQVLQMKEMNREVVDLRKQLAMTQTGTGVVCVCVCVCVCAFI